MDLLPAPRSLKILEESIIVQYPLIVRVSKLSKRFQRIFAFQGIDLVVDDEDPSVQFSLVQGQHQPEGYSLAILESGKIQISASDEAGLFYGFCTLIQIVQLSKPSGGVAVLPCLSIDDHPSLQHRGVMLDISRDKVPQVDTLCRLLSLLALHKINHVELYMEHTYAYEGHEAVWREADALSAEDLRVLREFCADRFIELVPNQNTFGHMHRWLTHDAYRDLAECPDGWDHPFAMVPNEPFSLCPTDPRTLPFVRSLMKQLLPNFPNARWINVGMDETEDLGKGRSKAACDEKGTGRVYLDFLLAVHNMLKEERPDSRMMFWADIVDSHPELIPCLPKDAVPMIWGYERQKDWARPLQTYAEHGIKCFVCPGTSSWNTFSGRTNNALENVARAAVEGVQHGALGMLTTDWGDHGHMQPLPISYPGLLACAAFSWNHDHAKSFLESSQDPNLRNREWLQRALDAFVFKDKKGVIGAALLDLGNAYSICGGHTGNSSFLFRMICYPKDALTSGRVGSEGVTQDTLTQCELALDRIESQMAPSLLECDDAPIIKDELACVVGMLRFCCALGKARLATGLPSPFIRDIAPEKKSELAKWLSTIIEKQSAVWLARNRQGGLKDSIKKLQNVLDELQ